MFANENGVYIFLEYLVVIIILIKIFAYVTLGISKCNTCLVGKTVLITGGNSGLGYETALSLASRGARIIIADKDDSTESINKIKEITSNRNVTYKHLDLSSFASVRKFAKEINQEESRLDILLNNAGSSGFGDTFTEDGLPLGMQVNFLGAFLLTHLLIGLLKKSAPSRILFLSSVLAFTNNLSLENLNTIPRAIVSPLQEIFVYGNSKLMNIIGANIFAEKLRGSGVTSNSLHPGIIGTSIFSKQKALNISNYLAGIIFCDTLIFLFGKTTWQGVQTQTHCALSKDLNNVTGKYFFDCRVFPQPMKAWRKDLCMKLWKKCEDLVKLSEAEKIL